MNICAVDWWRHERDAWAAGFAPVCGIDEAGRGPLAGPVVAACVVLPPDFPTDGINDSKKLSPKRREAACARILAQAVAVGIGQVDAPQIDEINILRATHLAMRLALENLPPDFLPALVLVDGLPVPHLPCAQQRALVGGDGLSVSIAAASIVAKTTRDALMTQADQDYPGYGFAGHKGYGAATHMQALLDLGPCPLHRRSFAPVRAALRGGNT